MKKKNVFVVVIFLISITCIVFAAPADTVVYITKTGEKYHRGSCSYLRNSKIEVTLGTAVSQGYGPCSRCNPPVPDK